MSTGTALRREEFVYDTTNERVIICAAIAMALAQRAVLVRSVAADELLHPEHVIIWRALRVMVEQGLEYDASVMRRLILDEGGRVESAYLSELEAEAAIPANLDWHLGMLRWDATRARLLQGAMPELLRALKEPKSSPERVAAAAHALLKGLDGGGGRRFIRRKEELARSYKAEVAARVAVGNFFPFHYEAMDHRLSEGSMRQRTCVVAGLSGSGKSTWLASLALNLALKGNRRVLLGAWEMGAESTLDVMIAGMTRIELERIVSGDLTPEEVASVHAATDRICSRITFMENAFFAERKKGERRSNERNMAILEGYVAESGCDVLIMDLWERMLVDIGYEGVTTALYEQQDLHKRYNVYGIIAHQLSKEGLSKRLDRRPTRESIKGTGAFYEVADQVLGVHREALFKNVPDESLEVICLKQKKGKANWAVRFKWNGEMALVEDGEEVPYDPGLDSGEKSGDLSEIRTGSGARRKTSRREGG